LAACNGQTQSLSANAPACGPIRAIRAGCRKFYDEQHDEFPFFGGDWPRRGSPGFFVALGAARSAIGYQIAVLAGLYDLELEGELTTILPVGGDDD